MPTQLFKNSLARWLSICVVALAATFIANTLYIRRVSSLIDTNADSIANNSSRSVVDLDDVTEDIRAITARVAAVSGATSRSDDGKVMESALEDIDRAIAAYRLTPDYPGEYELYLEAERWREPFRSAVLDLIRAPDTQGGLPVAQRRFFPIADAFAGSIRALIRLNATHVAAEGAAISDARQRAGILAMFFRAGSLVLTAVSLVLAFATSRRHAAVTETAKRLTAEARADELDFFAGRVAHDLRSPLTVIELKSTTSERTDSPELLKDALRRIARQVQRMTAMIDALLVFAQSGAQGRPGTCDNVEEVIDEAVADSRSAAAEQGVDVVVEPVPEVRLGCSAAVLGIVISNLVRNAVKYIGGGTSGVRRVTLRAQEREGRLRIEVEDTGPGLPPGTEGAVFKPFVRMSGTTGGIGLGLATVKRLVEGHGGAVGVDSVLGRGCRFWFELSSEPRPFVSPKERHAPPPKPLNDGHSSPMKIAKIRIA